MKTNKALFGSSLPHGFLWAPAGIQLHTRRPQSPQGPGQESFFHPQALLMNLGGSWDSWPFLFNVATTVLCSVSSFCSSPPTNKLSPTPICFFYVHTRPHRCGMSDVSHALLVSVSSVLMLPWMNCSFIAARKRQISWRCFFKTSCGSWEMPLLVVDNVG